MNSKQNSNKTFTKAVLTRVLSSQNLFKIAFSSPKKTTLITAILTRVIPTKTKRRNRLNMIVLQARKS